MLRVLLSGCLAAPNSTLPSALKPPTLSGQRAAVLGRPPSRHPQVESVGRPGSGNSSKDRRESAAGTADIVQLRAELKAEINAGLRRVEAASAAETAELRKQVRDLQKRQEESFIPEPASAVRAPPAVATAASSRGLLHVTDDTFRVRFRPPSGHCHASPIDIPCAAQLVCLLALVCFFVSAPLATRKLVRTDSTSENLCAGG